MARPCFMLSPLSPTASKIQNRRDRKGSAVSGRRAILHGLFNLRDNVSENQFRPAFEAFVAHLAAAGFARGSRVMRRQHLDGFREELPTFLYYAAIEFSDLEGERACYDYVATGPEPVREIHHAMNALVCSGPAHFFVTFDI
jgi:hypothetical protein